MHRWIDLQQCIQICALLKQFKETQHCIDPIIITKISIFKEKDGKRLEPYEELTLDMPEESMGKVMESMGARKAQMITMGKATRILRTGS